MRKYAGLWVDWLLIHHVTVRWLLSQGESWQTIRYQVNEQQRATPAEDHRHNDHDNFWHVSTHQEVNRLTDVAVNATAFFNRMHDCREVIVGQDDISRFTGNVGSSLTHGDSGISSIQGWRIVHTIPSHRHHITTLLPGLNNSNLILWRNTGIDGIVLDCCIQLLIWHGVQFSTR